MTDAAIYCRISKDDKGTALGVRRQERVCRELGEQRNLNVVDVFVDNDTSAYNGKRRPGLEALLAAADNGQIGAVVVYHVDRLYRRVVELERLVTLVERTGLAVYTVAAGDLDLTTASGQMTARILSSVAQGEVARLSERLRAKSDDLARAGRPPGGRPPYGYSPGYVVNEDEARWVRHAVDRALAGWSLVRIAHELDDLGVPTRQGKPWHHSTIARILTGPAIAGLRVHRREIAGPGSWEPIIDRETWDQLRATLADPARRKRRSGGAYLLSGLVRSPSGHPLNGCLGRDGRAYSTRSGYHTIHPDADTVHAQVKADRLEATVVEAVLKRFDGATIPTGDTTNDDAVDAIEAEMNELARLRGEGVVSMAEWLAAREPLQERLAAARAAVKPRVPLPHAGPSLRVQWPELDVTQRQAVIRTVIDKVVVSPAGMNRHMPIVDRIDVDWRA